MKKILSRIFSVVLATSTALTMTAAPQMAKKVVDPQGKQTQNVMTAKAVSAPQKAKGKKGVQMPERRTVGQNVFRQAKTLATAPKTKAVPMHVEGVPTIYGVVTFANSWTQENAPAGFYQVPTSDSQDFELLFENANVTYGGCNTPDFYVGFNYLNYGFFALGYYTVTNLESGETTAQIYMDDLYDLCSGCSYDPITGDVFGISMTDDGGMCLARYEVSETGYTKTIIKALEGSWQDTAIDKTGKLYVIDKEGMLYTADKTTGDMTQIGSTGVTPHYIAGAVIDQQTGRMFWSVSTDDGGFLYEVNTTTGAATLLTEFADGQEVIGLYILGPAAEDGAPAECKNVTVNFENDALNGTVNLSSPATLFDGTQGSGELIITVLANGDQVGYAEPNWNSQVSIPVDLSLMGAGSYTFTVFASNEVGEGPKTKIKNIWVGADTPEATKATLTYANGNMEVSWLPVTSSVNGGYLDLDNLSYTVKNKDGEVVAEGLTVTSFSEPVAAPEDITSFFYTVEVKCGDLVSAPAQTNTVILGSIIPPYQSDFSNAGLSGWTVIDANGDDYTWTPYGNEGEVRVHYNGAMAMDDWLITPPVKLEAGKAYEFAMQAKANGTSFPERVEVKYGKANTVAGKTNDLIAPTVLTDANYRELSNFIVPDESGIYFVGIHGISDADMFYLYVKDVQIKEGISALAPGMATNLVATPDANGDKKCEVSFNAPAETMNGQALSSLTKVELYRDGELINTFDAPAPGAALSYNDVLENGGNVTYSVFGYNAEGKGLEATVSTFVGFDKPAAVPSASIATTATLGEVVCTWEAVTEDVNGSALPASAVTYTVCDYEGGAWTPIVEGLTATTYSYQAVAAGEQDFVQLAVFAVTDGGTGQGTATDMIPVGTPYNGISESFADGTLSYIWRLRGIDGGSAQICTDSQFEGMPSQDGDNGFLDLYANYLDAGCDFFSGLISLDQIENPGLTFYVFNIQGDNPNINEVSVSVKEAGSDEWVEVMAPKTVDDLCGGEPSVWAKVTVPLGAYANKTIQFQITAIVKQYIHNFFDNFKVGSILGHDLAAASISAPAKAKCGEDYTVNVKVSNEGAQAAAEYIVELYADEDLVASKEMTDLASASSTTVAFERTMSALATEPVSYFAKVVYAEDENESNNQTSSLTVTPVVSNLPVATDLSADQTDGNAVKLTWSEPNLEGGVPEEITDDFEDGDAFAAEYGNWTFVDVDGAKVGGFQGLDIPGIGPNEATGSFWIWDQETMEPQEGNTAASFNAYSGNKYLFALFRYDDGQTDDWAISPELTGDAQTISFYAKSYQAAYPETIAVYYSTGSLDPDDFVLVDGSEVAAVPQDWTNYSVDLPAGAKHFAIRSYASSSFMLMVDDVTYTPAGVTANIEIAGYNVYRDGVKINDALVEDTEYVDNNVEVGKQYTYVVTVVYTDKGESAGSNEAVITVSGVDTIGAGAVAIAAQGHSIVVLNALDMNVSVVAANGAVVYNGLGQAKTTVAVAPGVYVVKAGKTVKKVIVK